MAVTKRAILAKRYNNEKLPKYRHEYAERKGTPIGFRDSPEFKRWERAKDMAIYRQKVRERDLNIAEKLVKSDVDGDLLNPLPTVENINVLEAGKPFFDVLSYGDDEEKIAIEGANLLKEENNNKLTMVVDSTEIGGEVKAFTSKFEYEKEIKRIYKECRKEQTRNKTYPIISVVSCTVNGRETLFVKIKSETKWEKPQPKKKK